MENWYIGTIGFSYKDWVGPFYPPGTTQRGYLPYYVKYFTSVEINTTFHAMPRPSNVQTWADSTPQNFKFCLKTPHRITHELRLIDAESMMDEFLDTLQPLGNKIGPILIQLPPKFTQDNFDILKTFIEYLPTNYQFAIEFRHASWYNVRTTELLSRHQVCFVTIDYPNLPKEITLTTNFIYLRWIGINNLYHHHTYERVDKSSQLKWWLELIRSAAKEVDKVYGFFNNDYAGFAAGTCQRFMQIAGLSGGDNHISQQESFL